MQFYSVHSVYMVSYEYWATLCHADCTSKLKSCKRSRREFQWGFVAKQVANRYYGWLGLAESWLTGASMASAYQIEVDKGEDLVRLSPRAHRGNSNNQVITLKNNLIWFKTKTICKSISYR